MIVFIENVEGYVFGLGVERRRMRRAFDLDGFAAVKLLLRLCGLAFDADLAALDEELDAGAADIRNRLGKILVEAQVGGGGIGGEGVNMILGVIVEVYVEHGDGWRGRFFDAAGGAVFVLYRATALPLWEHIFRRHERPAFGMAGR